MHGHFKTPQGFSVTLNIDSTAEAERIFRDLAEAGTVQTVDRFGTPWMINCDGKT